MNVLNVAIAENLGARAVKNIMLIVIALGHIVKRKKTMWSWFIAPPVEREMILKSLILLQT